MANDHPPIRNEVVDGLHNMLTNVISHYLKKHADMSNEELDIVFNRVLDFQLQNKIHMYSLYVWDMKNVDNINVAFKSKKPSFIG